MNSIPIGDPPIHGGVSYGTFGSGHNAVFFPDAEVRLSQEEFARLHQRIGFLESVMLTAVEPNMSDDAFEKLQAAYNRICGILTVKYEGETNA